MVLSIGKLFRIDLQFLASVSIRRSWPGLKALTHRPARPAVDPLVEFPLPVLAEPFELRQLEQFAAGDFVQAEPMDEPHPRAADERPGVPEATASPSPNRRRMHRAKMLSRRVRGAGCRRRHACRQFPFDDRDDLWSIRLRAGAKPSDDRAVAVAQEFLEVPADLAGPLGSSSQLGFGSPPLARSCGDAIPAWHHAPTSIGGGLSVRSMWGGMATPTPYMAGAGGLPCGIRWTLGGMATAGHADHVHRRTVRRDERPPLARPGSGRSGVKRHRASRSRLFRVDTMAWKGRRTEVRP